MWRGLPRPPLPPPHERPSRVSPRWPQARRVHVFAGLGNNAGDGYLVADLAHRAGLEVRLFAVADPSQLQGDAGAKACHRLRIEVEYAIEDSLVEFTEERALSCNHCIEHNAQRPYIGAVIDGT